MGCEIAAKHSLKGERTMGPILGSQPRSLFLFLVLTSIIQPAFQRTKVSRCVSDTMACVRGKKCGFDGSRGRSALDDRQNTDSIIAAAAFIAVR